MSRQAPPHWSTHIYMGRQPPPQSSTHMYMDKHEHPIDPYIFIITIMNLYSSGSIKMLTGADCVDIPG